MRKFLKNQINRLPYVKGLYAHYYNYRKNACYPPGHFYSPIVSVNEIKESEQAIWKNSGNTSLPGVQLNLEQQEKLLSSLQSFYDEIPFHPTKSENLRYYFENEMYTYTDGIILYSLTRHLKPKRIIEIGSGFSSALMLDVNQMYFDNSIDLHFIEPFPERLYKNLLKSDYDRVTIHQKKVQEIPASYFEKLDKGDILFVDSTHVSKTGSDVNYIFFEILPVLKPGVWIHFHDIFYPFEYPKGWVYQGRNWNENYLLRAFLMNNSEYAIRMFPHYLHNVRSDLFREMPLAYKNQGGNIWIEKLS